MSQPDVEKRRAQGGEQEHGEAGRAEEAVSTKGNCLLYIFPRLSAQI